MEIKYIIRIGCKLNDSCRCKWSYYNGHTYKCKGEHFVDDFCDIDKAKRYSNRNAAEKTAEKLYNKCENVDVWLIEEVEE